MADIRKKLAERALAGARKPKPDRHRNDRERRFQGGPGYKVVSVSLYTAEAAWLDETAGILRGVWNPKANRSLVVREALLRLQEELEGKSPAEILRYFTDRKAQRAGRS
jgi:hypothetical protein